MPSAEHDRKSALRAAFRRKRRALNGDCQRRHATLAMQAALPHFDSTDRVAAYLARDGEVNLSPLIEACGWRSALQIMGCLILPVIPVALLAVPPVSLRPALPRAIHLPLPGARDFLHLVGTPHLLDLDMVVSSKRDGKESMQLV